MRKMFNHSESALLEESLKALPGKLAGKSAAALLQARWTQSQHRYSEVNTPLARLLSLSQRLWTARCMLNLTRCAPVSPSTTAIRKSLRAVPPDEPLARFYSRTRATSVHGEVLHCKGDAPPVFIADAATEQICHHIVWHYALCYQQSEIQFARDSAGRMGNAGESLPADQRATPGTTADVAASGMHPRAIVLWARAFNEAGGLGAQRYRCAVHPSSRNNSWQCLTRFGAVCFAGAR